MNDRRTRLVALLSDFFDVSPAEVEVLLRKAETDPNVSPHDDVNASPTDDTFTCG